MFVDLLCSCGARFNMNIDEPDEESTPPLWSLIFRFSMAHGKCGYMTSGVSPESGNVDPFKPRLNDEDGEQ